MEAHGARSLAPDLPQEPATIPHSTFLQSERAYTLTRTTHVCRRTTTCCPPKYSQSRAIAKRTKTRWRTSSRHRDYVPNTTPQEPAPTAPELSLLSALRLVTAQPASFATGETKLTSAQHKPHHEIEASGTKLKPAQGKPRHEIEATTHSASTQQQHLKRPTLYFGLPGFANSRTSQAWSSRKASSSMLALAVLLCSVLPQTNASASLVQSTSASFESDSEARSRPLSEPLAHPQPPYPPYPPYSRTASMHDFHATPTTPLAQLDAPRPTHFMHVVPASAK